MLEEMLSTLNHHCCVDVPYKRSDLEYIVAFCGQQEAHHIIIVTEAVPTGSFVNDTPVAFVFLLVLAIILLIIAGPAPTG